MPSEHIIQYSYFQNTTALRRITESVLTSANGVILETWFAYSSWTTDITPGLWWGWCDSVFLPCFEFSYFCLFDIFHFLPFHLCLFSTNEFVCSIDIYSFIKYLCQSAVMQLKSSLFVTCLVLIFIKKDTNLTKCILLF